MKENNTSRGACRKDVDSQLYLFYPDNPLAFIIFFHTLYQDTNTVET